MSRILCALGGNAIKRAKDKGTSAELLQATKSSSQALAGLFADGKSSKVKRMVVTHGNGPQVGAILARNERCAPDIPAWDLGLCVAESEGLLGYVFQQQLGNELLRANHPHGVASLVTQMVVSRQDPAFENPDKPIGDFVNEEKAHIAMKNGVVMKKDAAGRGWRRVVASPKPIRLVEADIVKSMFDSSECILIAAGGGGVPVFAQADGTLTGCDAVIDKDHAAVVLSRAIGSIDCLVLITDVEHVYLDFGKPTQKPLHKITVKQAKSYLAEGIHFEAGSMLPKVEACVQFLEESESGSSPRTAIIASIDKIPQALAGESGTTFVL